MTREELFSLFPRPWRQSDDDAGVVLDANGAEVLTIDTVGERSLEAIEALAELITEHVNEADE